MDKKLEKWASERKWKLQYIHSSGSTPLSPEFCAKVETARKKLSKSHVTADYTATSISANPCSVFWLENEKKEWIAFTVFTLRYKKYFQKSIGLQSYPEKICSFLLDNATTDGIAFLDVWCAQKGLGLCILCYSLQKRNCPI